MNDNVIPLRPGRPDEIENACTGRLPDELLAPICAGSVDPRPDPDDLDQDPIEARLIWGWPPAPPGLGLK